MNSGPNWLGLLKWSLAQSDGTSPSNFHEMSIEDRRWLEEVMKDGVKDEPKRMGEIIQEISQTLETKVVNEDKIEESLEELIDITGQIDMAQVFVKFGGLAFLFKLIDWNEFPTRLRALAASSINTISQNNIKVQKLMHSDGTLDRLVESFFSNRDTPILCSKILSAISGLIRGHREGEQAFILNHSHSVFQSIFQPSDLTSPTHHLTSPELLRRSLFLADALYTSPYILPLSLPSSHLDSPFYSASHSPPSPFLSPLPIFLPTIFSLISSPHIDVRENAFRLILTLCRSHTLSRSFLSPTDPDSSSNPSPQHSIDLSNPTPTQIPTSISTRPLDGDLTVEWGGRAFIREAAGVKEGWAQAVRVWESEGPVSHDEDLEGYLQSREIQRKMIRGVWEALSKKPVPSSSSSSCSSTSLSTGIGGGGAETVFLLGPSVTSPSPSPSPV